MNNPEPETNNSNNNNDTHDDRMCWICLGNDAEDTPPTTTTTTATIDWVHPCRCRGSSKWVHAICLGRWIDEKQSHDPYTPVVCTQCRTEYVVIMPSLCAFDKMLDQLDTAADRISPTVVMGMMAASLYFVTVTYGAITVLQINGIEEGLQLLQDEQKLLMVVLPVVPTLLLLSRLIHWDDAVFRFLLRLNRHHVPAEHLNEFGEPLPGAPLDDYYFEQLEREYPRVDMQPQGGGGGAVGGGGGGAALFNGGDGEDHFVNTARNVCMALSLPTLAVLTSKLIYNHIVDNQQMAILFGGLTVVCVKGLAGLYLRICQLRRRRQRYTVDFASQFQNNNSTTATTTTTTARRR